MQFQTTHGLQRAAIGTLFDVCGSLVAQTNSENELLLSTFQNHYQETTSSMNHEEVYLLNE